jgi:hypothetical protein
MIGASDGSWALALDASTKAPTAQANAVTKNCFLAVAGVAISIDRSWFKTASVRKNRRKPNAESIGLN